MILEGLIMENKSIGSNWADVRKEMFTDEEIDILKEKPVRQLKVFRLGLVQDEGPCAKSISKSVWCKLK